MRPQLERLQPRDDGHIVVYQTGTGHPRLLSALHELRERRFRVYGVRRDGAPAHVEYRPFSEPQFLDDLASASAVIANGGYTTLSEAVCLGKPVLSVPIRHQGEQELNAAWIEHLGLGATMRWPPTARRVRRALDEILQQPVRRPVPSGSTAACHALDQAIKELT